MKWTTPTEPLDGETRDRRKFAWVPIRCTDGTTRWLETIIVRERYVHGTLHPGFNYWSSYKTYIGLDYFWC